MNKYFSLVFIFLFTICAAAQKSPITIFLAGDSTMAQKQPDKRPETGWGEMLGQFFKEGKVRMDNRAANGRSTKSFISEGRWQGIVNGIRKGDYVFIQFGHNDESKDKGERYTPPDEYRKNLIRMTEEVRAKGADPVLLTPVMRRRFDKEGNFYDTHGEYPDLVRAVAKEYKVPLIDMHRKSETLIRKLGVEESKKLFLILAKGESPNYPNGLDDNTHFKPFGAEEMAKLAVEGIRENKLGLKKYLKK
jgi:lysophospholipase L1-like esterase